jgi:hypothetical protein
LTSEVRQGDSARGRFPQNWRPVVYQTPPPILTKFATFGIANAGTVFDKRTWAVNTDIDEIAGARPGACQPFAPDASVAGRPTLAREPASMPRNRLSVNEPPSRRPAAGLCFLLSSARGGSTLVSRVLDSHSCIASPCEICLPYVVLRSWKLPRSLDRLRRICRYYETPFPILTLSLVLRSTARRHLAKLTRSILEREQKQTLVIKDPRHAAHLGRLEKLCGNQRPRYILLVRDARAVVGSFKNSLGRPMERGFRVWKEATAAMVHLRQTLPADQCHVLRFEDFLASPAETVARLVEFLGYEFEPEMLNYGRFPHADDRLNLWTNIKHIVSVNTGEIQTPLRSSWIDDAELQQAYAERTDIQQLNQAIGYDLDPADRPDNSSPVPLRSHQFANPLAARAQLAAKPF